KMRSSNAVWMEAIHGLAFYAIWVCRIDFSHFHRTRLLHSIIIQISPIVRDRIILLFMFLCQWVLHSLCSALRLPITEMKNGGPWMMCGSRKLPTVLESTIHCPMLICFPL